MPEETAKKENLKMAASEDQQVKHGIFSSLNYNFTYDLNQGYYYFAKK